jgi:hypothetical protein
MRKIISLFMASILLTLLFSSMVSSETVDTIPFSDGSGTLSDPYQITTIEELDAIRDYLDKSYILMNSLDFEDDASYFDPNNKDTYVAGDGWNPIGHYTEGTEFSGSFDGQGYTISNLFINRSHSGYSSLFGYVLEAEISHLGLTDVSITSRGSAGGIAGHNERGVLSDCFVTGQVKDLIGSSFYVGGLVGRNNGTISDCHTSVNVRGDLYVGGLVGYNEGVIVNSSATKDVIGSNFKNNVRNIGGLVGGNAGFVVDSFALGNVTGSTYVGGLVGANWHTISSCYATGKVTGIWYNFGNITFGRRYVGPLTGANFGSVSDSYATGRATLRGYVFGVFYQIISHLLPKWFIP